MQAYQSRERMACSLVGVLMSPYIRAIQFSFLPRPNDPHPNPLPGQGEGIFGKLNSPAPYILWLDLPW